MNTYVVAAAIGNTDLATIRLVEALMDLDPLSMGHFEAVGADAFREEARAALTEAAAMHERGELRDYCATRGLAVPMRFQGGAR